ncbi:hypothetical protein [Williamwhitmania taraxaci]|uniref:Uncharacterized protein n=1 Tax=Williamwhitmania taraxaci TaxID=1640674 RepID=A0A1G6NME3_9BACT|nr:hypothetical protein [Williamwhitmania taraxaci]SDC68564.1 hypothetical protein SAMN05216323_104412 [Williamwhitmania taraxaci]
MKEEIVNSEIERLKAEINFHKIEKTARWSQRIGIVTLSVLFILFAAGTLRLSYLMKEVGDLEAKRKALKIENQTLEKKNLQLKTALVPYFGLSTDSIKNIAVSPVFEKSLSANAALKTLARHSSPTKKTIVTYYTKTIDEQRVVQELKNLGFKFQERPPSTRMSKKETNALWYGSQVPLDDAKMVALTLLRAGIHIKSIRPFRSNSLNPAFKKNIIEVGASTDLEQLPDLSVERVDKAESFER